MNSQVNKSFLRRLGQDFFFGQLGWLLLGLALDPSELEKHERDWKAMLLSFDFICFYI